jgi:hypothetical protein
MARSIMPKATKFKRGDTVVMGGEAYPVVGTTETGYLFESLHSGHPRFELTFEQAEEAGIRSAP